MVRAEMAAALGIDDSYSVSYIVVGPSDQVDGADKVLATACPYEVVDCYKRVFSMLQLTLKSLGLPAGCIPTVLDYYESTDAASLTRKLCSIAAFQGIPSPMRVCQDGRYEPDFNSRYFTEDFPYGLRFARDVARQNGVACPHMDEVMDWGLSRLQGV